MKEEILINVTSQECRIAVIENGMLQEIYLERESGRGLVGNIYRAKVIRVLPGMQAAFITLEENVLHFYMQQIYHLFQNQN